MYRLETKLSILIILFFLLEGCSGTRVLKTQELLIDKTEIFENEQLLKNNVKRILALMDTAPNWLANTWILL